MSNWIAKAVGLMHIHKITHRQLAEKMGYSREYITRILTEKVSPPGIKERVMAAISEIIEERKVGA